VLRDILNDYEDLLCNHTAVSVEHMDHALNSLRSASRKVHDLALPRHHFAQSLKLRPSNAAPPVRSYELNEKCHGTRSFTGDVHADRRVR
jgi:hypothetical protein